MDCMDEVFGFVPGDAPLLVSVPHAGTRIPPAIAATMTPEALRTEDTDWFVDALYDVAPRLGIGLIVARQSRYVVDINRDPTNASLYPGRSVTELVPLTTFAFEPIYAAGREPGPAEVEARVNHYWRPYHDALRAEVGRLRARHGVAVLWDGHSIRSQVPRFFDGTLADMNFGSVHGQSADPSLVAAVHRAAQGHGGYSVVWDGRFVGGHITRSLGRPAEGVHAIQLEMTWRTYMAEQAPYRLDPERADRARCFIAGCLAAARDWALAASSSATARAG